LCWYRNGPLSNARQATVIDGDTIEIHQQRIRLSGIDALESDQLCRSDNSLPYRYGAKAANQLDRFIAGRPVTCIDIGERTYKQVVAVCSVGSFDQPTGCCAKDWRSIGRNTRKATTRRHRMKRGKPSAVSGRAVMPCRGATGLASAAVGGLVIGLRCAAA